MITHHLSETPTKFTFVPLHTLNTGTQDLQERNYFPHRRANTPGAEQVIWYENKPTHCRYCSVTQSCPTLCNPMDCSIPGFPVLHCLPEFTQVHWVSDAIQLSHPLLPSSPPALSLSQHWGLFQWVGSLHQVLKVQLLASVLPRNIPSIGVIRTVWGVSYSVCWHFSWQPQKECSHL